MHMITEDEWNQRLETYKELKKHGKSDAVIAEMYMYVTAQSLENWKHRWRKEGKLPSIPTQEEWVQIHIDRYNTFHKLIKTLGTHNKVAKEMGICPVNLRASLKKVKGMLENGKSIKETE